MNRSGWLALRPAPDIALKSKREHPLRSGGGVPFAIDAFLRRFLRNEIFKNRGSTVFFQCFHYGLFADGPADLMHLINLTHQAEADAAANSP